MARRGRRGSSPLMMMRGLGLANYLLLDDFLTQQAAPMPASRDAEPGPGVMTKGADTGEYGSINASEQFVWSGGPGDFGGDPNYRWSSVARAAGRVLYLRVITGGTTGTGFVGWYRTDSVASNWPARADGFQLSSSVLSVSYGGVLNVATSSIANMDTNTTYDLAIVLHTAGAAWYIRGGDFGSEWVLLFNDLIDNTATLYPMQINHSSQHATDSIKVHDLPGEWQNDYPFATVNLTNPTTGQGGTASADGVHEIRFTLNGSPSANDVGAELRYRVQDANNYWVARIVRNAGNSAWDYQLNSVSAGTPTTRASVTGVGTPDAIQVRVHDTRHNVYTKAATTWTKRGNEVNVSHLDTQAAISVVYPAGSVSRLVSMPYKSAQYEAWLNLFLV